MRKPHLTKALALARGALICTDHRKTFGSHRRALVGGIVSKCGPVDISTSALPMKEGSKHGTKTVRLGSGITYLPGSSSEEASRIEGPRGPGYHRNTMVSNINFLLLCLYQTQYPCQCHSWCAELQCSSLLIRPLYLGRP
jgi:hypothetical protein